MDCMYVVGAGEWLNYLMEEMNGLPNGKWWGGRDAAFCRFWVDETSKEAPRSTGRGHEERDR
jgi:hypothetical protein